MKDKYAYPTISNLGPRPGMELRDWFAGQALQAIGSKNSPYDTARAAYMFADALMEIRNKEES